MPVTHFLAFDVETTGPSIGVHFCPEFGAALVEIESGKEVWRYHTYCAQPEGRIWEKATLDEFWLAKVRPRYDAILAELKTAPPAGEAMKRFVTEVRAAIKEHVPGGHKCVQLISDTTGFDSAFMESMFTPDCGAASLRTLCDETDNRPLRDVSSVYLGVAGVSSSENLEKNPETGKRLKTLEAACIALGIPQPTTSCDHSHNPADDASYIAQCYAHVDKGMKKRKSTEK